MDNSYFTSKQVVEETVYYTLAWSGLAKVDKFEIIKKVPAMSGIFQLFYEDKYKKPIIMYMARVWYGGLRAILREITDPLLTGDVNRRQVLETRSCYYRYTQVASQEDMEDLIHYLGLRILPPSQVPPPSGRFEEIYVQEIGEALIEG
ncbi:MAG: hypothetical protein LBQ61_01355 [Spirochaetales bacterium]|jgi:hypothetical protein|nr:hypothetical protein [Spirochaetales bacterium]